MTAALVEQTDAINALLRRADAGDARALAALRGQAADSPALWHEFGDLARQVRVKLIDRIAGANEFVGEAVSREVAALRGAWVGTAPTPLEAALGERIAACWLHLHYVEATYAQRASGGGEGLSWAEDEAHRKRVEQAERRYLRAIKALAEVRRLQLPAVQLNIGAKQVNVAR